MNRRRALSALAASAAACHLPAVAQGKWPSSPVRVIVPYPPGGSVDLAARVVFESVGRMLDASFIIDNKPGGNGGIGMTAAARSKPDGYTFVVAADATTYHPLIEERPQFDMSRDFTPVCLFVQQPLLIVASKSSGIRSIVDLVERAKRNPGKIAYGVTGIGTTLHMAAEAFSQAAGIALTHVPYKGGGQAVVDLVSGTIPLAVLGPGPVLPHARNGAVVLLAVTSKERSASVPQVPALAELGFPKVDISQWIGLFAPKGAPQETTQALAASVAAALKQPEIRARLVENGIDPDGRGPDELAVQQKTGSARWFATVKRLNLVPG